MMTLLVSSAAIILIVCAVYATGFSIVADVSRTKQALTTKLLLSNSNSGISSATHPQRSSGRRSSDRPRRPPPNRSRRSKSSSSSVATNTTATVVERKRAPHQFDHTKADARPFLDDPGSYVKQQSPNLNAPYYTFPEEDETEDDDGSKKLVKDGSHIKSLSLDSLFPNLYFSQKFCTNTQFREALRNSMREDIFDSTPSYEDMSEKARRMLLLPDSSLQGSWKGREQMTRMKKLTAVLTNYLGDSAPTGDSFMEKIGQLCGSKASTHWIDIVGVTDRMISHSWHQDGASQGNDTMTVLLGFPKEDNYDGVGVFSHAVNLKYERIAPDDHPPFEPVLYSNLLIDDEYVVKPRFAEGKEIIMFRDIDCLHSAPDVAYRTSVMRFM